MLGWAANVLLIVCAATVHKYRWSLLVGALGGLLWGIKALAAGWWDLLTIEIILSSLQIRGYFKWRR